MSIFPRAFILTALFPFPERTFEVTYLYRLTQLSRKTNQIKCNLFCCMRYYKIKKSYLNKLILLIFTPLKVYIHRFTRLERFFNK